MICQNKAAICTICLEPPFCISHQLPPITSTLGRIYSFFVALSQQHIVPENKSWLVTCIFHCNFYSFTLKQIALELTQQHIVRRHVPPIASINQKMCADALSFFSSFFFSLQF